MAIVFVDWDITPLGLFIDDDKLLPMGFTYLSKFITPSGLDENDDN